MGLQVAANAQADVQTRMQAAGLPTTLDAITSNGAAGIQAAIAGNQLTDAQVQSGFALGASAALVAAGVSVASALSIVAPMAAVVFGGGYAIGQAIMAVLGIHNAGAIACSSDDPTKYGDDPTSPNWITFQSYVDSNGPPPDGWPNGDNVPKHWLPYTNGSFENWARPIIQVAFELAANCKPIPGAKTWRDFANGLIATWNTAAPAGSPTRKIGYALDEQTGATYGSGLQLLVYRFANDPVQWLMQGGFGEQHLESDRTQVVAGALPHPWVIEVADPPLAPVTQTPQRVIQIRLPLMNLTSDKASAPISSSSSGSLSTGVKVALGVGIGVGAIALGTAGYALYTRQPVQAVAGHAWLKVKRFGRK